jgi:hypothetical protein
MAIMAAPVFRLLLLSAASAEGDDLLREAVNDHWQGNLNRRWKIVYEQILQARGLRLRPGVTLDLLADLLADLIAGLGDGLSLRAIADPCVGKVDHEQQRCYLGTGILALIRGCLEPGDDTDGLSLEEAVHAMVYDQAADHIGSDIPDV